MIRPEEMTKVIVDKAKENPSVDVQFATIADYSSGRPAVIMDGEDTATVKTFPFLASYTPTTGDRVMILNNVIMDRIAKTPSGDENNPAGEIQESGTNANGSYIRWTNGLQMCSGTAMLTYTGTRYVSGDWYYPKSFSSGVTATVSISDLANPAQLAFFDLLSVMHNGALFDRVNDIRVTCLPDKAFVEGDQIEVQCVAFGRCN